MRPSRGFQKYPCRSAGLSPAHITPITLIPWKAQPALSGSFVALSHQRCYKWTFWALSEKWSIRCVTFCYLHSKQTSNKETSICTSLCPWYALCSHLYLRTWTSSLPGKAFMWLVRSWPQIWQASFQTSLISLSKERSPMFVLFLH